MATERPSTRYSQPGVIAIDDVLIDHDGQFIKDVGWFWDHSEQCDELSPSEIASRFQIEGEAGLEATINGEVWVLDDKGSLARQEDEDGKKNNWFPRSIWQNLNGKRRRKKRRKIE